MTTVLQDLEAPAIILFDWHGTLVDTSAAMFEAMEETLPHFDELGLVDQLLEEDQCSSEDDVKLLRYIRIFRRLHPTILAERRISRTDIFNAIFGDNEKAKSIAHAAYNECYRNHFGMVKPFQQGELEYLRALHGLGIKLGVATNRSRQFLDHELEVVDNGQWLELIDVSVCASEVDSYKPAPDVVLAAVEKLEEKPGRHCWYIGDSYQDMVTAKKAGISAIFYNSAAWDENWIQRTFQSDDARPDAIVNSLDEVFDLLQELQEEGNWPNDSKVAELRPPYFPPPEPPKPHVLPDWHPEAAKLVAPELILFDWHATLVDTLDAMYHAVDEMLPELRELGLLDKIVKPEESRTPEDAKLVEYVLAYRQLHPKIKADRKISRTDIFEVLFGKDEQAKQEAHKAFTRHYRKHFGTAKSFEPEVRDLLVSLQRLGIKLGVITNRDREFFEHELANVDDIGWQGIFDTDVCGDDTKLRKPNPDQIYKALANLQANAGPAAWYVGDSTTDTIAAKRAGVTSVFFNGAQWSEDWLEKIFPGTEQHPWKPDVVVNSFSEFWALVLAVGMKS